MVSATYMIRIAEETTSVLRSAGIDAEYMILAGYHSWVVNGPNRRNVLWFRNDASQWFEPTHEASSRQKSVRIGKADARTIRLSYQVDRAILQSSENTARLRIADSWLRWRLEGGGEQVYVTDRGQLTAVLEFGVPFIVKAFLASLL